MVRFRKESNATILNPSDEFHSKFKCMQFTHRMIALTSIMKLIKRSRQGKAHVSKASSVFELD